MSNVESGRPLVQILLATFNGSKFLPKLLDSIKVQTYTNWIVSVSDDGSQDNTVNILSNYSEIERRIIVADTDRKGGVVKNFSFLLDNVDSRAEYFMFCDQDDIWHPDKISKMLESMQELESNLEASDPALVFSDMRLVDDSDGVMASSFYKANKIKPKNNLDFKFLVWKCTAYGCTFLFNKNLVDFSTPVPPGVAMHDHWLALMARCGGRLAFVNTTSLDYRQHGGNVVGGANKSLMGRLFSTRRTLVAIWRGSKSAKLHWEYLGRRGLLDYSFSNINLNSLAGRWKFIAEFVVPFWRERAANSFLFALFFLLAKNVR